MMRILPGLVICVLGWGTLGWAAGGASPQDIIAKTQAAAAMLAQSGEAGLHALSERQGPWVWKDTYVFAYDCDKQVILAHPIKHELMGKKFSDVTDMRGNLFLADLCAVGARRNGGWVEYWWPKPDSDAPVRKISYAVHVPGTAFQVGAGVYDYSLTVEELNALLE